MRTHRITAESADKAALHNGHGHSEIRQRWDPQQLIRRKLKAIAKFLKGIDRRVSLPSGNAAEVSWTEPAELRSFLIAEAAAAAQIKDGDG